MSITSPSGVNPGAGRQNRAHNSGEGEGYGEGEGERSSAHRSSTNRSSASRSRTLPTPSQPAAADNPLPLGRLALLIGAMVSLLAGLDAALLRLGLEAPAPSMDLANLHGTLMVFGFLGTAIALERAVALQSDRRARSKLAYLSPAASVAASLIALAQIAILGDGANRLIPALAWGAAMAGMCAMYVIVWKRQPMIAVLVQGLGALAGLGGILLWGRGFEAAQVVPWWAAFLVLTIIGERLELARIAFARGAVEARILGETLAVMLALVLSLYAPNVGYPLLGAALVALTLDTAAHDVARRTIFATGITRFMAACMLAGYAWALVAGGIWLLRGPVFSGYGYDTVVHALTIGFALSMVLAHAPVIVPAIARRPLPYSPAMWAVWGCLQAGLLIRVVSGVRDSEGAWQFGGAIDILAVLAFMVTTVGLIALSSRRQTLGSRAPK